MMTKIKIFSDYSCPYCFIGKGLIDQLSEIYELDVEWLPFELHPDTPMAGQKVSELFPKANVDYMFHTLNSAVKPYGLSFSGADAIFNTQRALMATEYARDKGKAHAFHDEVFKAYFTESRNVADPEVLKDIAARVGLDGADMMEQVLAGTYRHRLTEAKKAALYYGIRSTPTFIVAEKHKIVGVQPINVFKEVLSGAAD